ncbi:MAG: ATP-binding protein [Treponema sp.]|nr:ATP-binding protein [Treponema sp.]
MNGTKKNEWEDVYLDLLFGIIDAPEAKNKIIKSNIADASDISKWRNRIRFLTRTDHKRICDSLKEILSDKNIYPDEEIMEYIHKFINDNISIIKNIGEDVPTMINAADYVIYWFDILFKKSKSFLRAKSKKKPLFVIIGPPGIGKTTVIEKLREKEPWKKVLSTDEFFNDRIFDNKKRFIEEGGYTLDEFIKIKSMTGYKKSRSSLTGMKEFKNSNYPMDIRVLCYKIVILMAKVTGDFIDLDGKAIQNKNVIDLLRKNKFKIILIIPSLKAELIGKSEETIKEAEFLEYLSIYKEYPSKLLDCSYRENIREIMDNAVCKIFEDKKKNPDLTKLKCSICKCHIHPPGGCEHRAEDEEMWDKFETGLRNEIWHDRYSLYHNNYDIVVDRLSSTDIAEIVKKIEVFLEENRKN